MGELRICIFTETYYPVIGGGETQARLLAEGVLKEGISVIIVTRRSDPVLNKVEQVGEVEIHRLAPSGRGQLKKWGLALSAVPALIRLRGHYDVIFVSGFRIIGIAAVLAGKMLGKIVVLKADSQGEMSGSFFADGLAPLRLTPASWPFALFLRMRNQLLKRADAFTAITRGVRAEFIDAGIAETAVYDIPNCVDTSRFFPVNGEQKLERRARLGLPRQGKIVVYTGRLVSYKGLPLLLQVWSQLLSTHHCARLLLVGTGGLDIHNCESELKDYVARNDLRDSVLFTGSVQNVEEYLQASDVFVLPTEEDAFPGALIEAMACCLPVVTTPVGAIGTVIQDRRNGLMVEPGNAGQLVEALNLLLSDDALAACLGKEGWQTVQRQYSAAIVTHHYAQLFRTLAR